MARTVTLAQLKTQILTRCDMQDSDYVSSSNGELLSYINASIGELYDELVTHFGQQYFLTSHQFTTANGIEEYDLPEDFYKMEGVDAQVSNGVWRSIQGFQFAERNRYRLQPGFTGPWFTNLKYRVFGTSKIVFAPIPSGAVNIRLWYTPAPPVLENDDDTIDGISGWEEYVILDVCIKCLQKEQSDISAWMAQKDRMKERISAAASNKDVGTVEQAILSGADDPNPWGPGDGW